MLPQRPEVGQGQPADPARPLPAADPDEGPGGLSGERAAARLGKRSSQRSSTLTLRGILLTLLSKATSFIHTFAHRRTSLPRRATASSFGAVRVRGLAQGHLDTQLEGAGDRTSDFPVIFYT